MTPADHPERPILDHLESLQDMVLEQLDELNQRLEATLANLGVRVGRSSPAKAYVDNASQATASMGSEIASN
jgi:hypothetical protein